MKLNLFKNKKYLTLLMALILQGCYSIAPISSDTTARTNGKGNWNTSLSASIPVGAIALRQGYGVSDNLDLEFVGETENQIVGLGARYALVNQPKGFSAALIGGTGGGRIDDEAFGVTTKATSIYGYLGGITSYKTRWVEPYLGARYNLVHVTTEVTTDFANEDIVAKNFVNYGHFTLGSTLWITEKFGLTANANLLVLANTDDDDGNRVDTIDIYNFGFVLRY